MLGGTQTPIQGLGSRTIASDSAQVAPNDHLADVGLYTAVVPGA
jgi:hypothetical protein